MQFDIFNPNTYSLVKDDNIFYVNERDIYTADFSNKMQLKDFLRLLQHNIFLAEQKNKNFSGVDRNQLIKDIILDFYRNNTIEGLAELYSRHSIYDEKSWINFPDIPLMYKNEIIISPETRKPVKARDFIKLLQAVKKATKQDYLSKEQIDRLLQRMLDAQKQPKKPFVLTPETEDKTESGFNPYDISTYSLASEKRIMRARGVLVYTENNSNGTPVYESEKTWRNVIEMQFQVYSKHGETKETLINRQIEMDYKLCNPKDTAPAFTINGFSFSKALCDCCRDTEKETLEKVANAMNYCIEQNYKEYQYKQYFFDKRIPASQEFFVDIYFAEQCGLREDVDNLIIDFYAQFEPDTKEELNNILHRSLYLKAHPELIPQIENCFNDYFSDE